MNRENKDYISKKEFNFMKKDSIILNFSRGGIINEKDLYSWLKKNPEARVSIDVFKNEPYKGELTNLDNCYLSPHLGSCSEKSRFNMEVGTVNNLLNALKIRNNSILSR